MRVPSPTIVREERMDTLEEGVERLRQVVARHILPMLTSHRTCCPLAPPLNAGATPPPAGVVQRHAFLELGIVVEGVMGMWWRGQLTLCPAGTVLVIPPRCPHLPHVPSPQGAPHRVIWLIFPPRQCIAHQCAWRDGVHFVGTYCVIDDEDLIYLGRSIWREWRQRDEHSALIVHGYLLSLLGRMLKAPARPAVPKYERLDIVPATADPLVQTVYRFLWSNYNRPIKLTDLSSAVAYSPTYLCRRFRQLTGETLWQALRRIRIEVAKRLLGLNISVATVAEMVGFADALYFSKVFSKEVGMTPTAYQLHCRRKGR